MFLSGQVNFFSQLVLGQVDFCNISTALHNIDFYGEISIFLLSLNYHQIPTLSICLCIFITRLDEATRKVYKDGKRYIETNNGKRTPELWPFVKLVYHTCVF